MHGEGGRAMRRLIAREIVSHFPSAVAQRMSDAAHLPRFDGPIAVTTDSFVVSPILFPGGDIGSLAVFGTINDLAVSGATPKFLTLSLIIEEGFAIGDLRRILISVADAAKQTGVEVVAGDTKVVPKGMADGIYITTTGIGRVNETAPTGEHSIVAGDQLIVTGPIGRHGIAVMCAREHLNFQPPPTSDSASLLPATQMLQECFPGKIRAMRDATRGGVAAVLHEWAEQCELTLSINESSVPVTSDVRGVSELLGLDPLNIANEGTMVIAVAADIAAEVVARLQSLPQHDLAAEIGTVEPRSRFPVTITRIFGRKQPLDEPLGAPLPRIC
ncbi:MAG: hydrogenase expression/formation protein HypE [Planctomycetaceae bacterium]